MRPIPPLLALLGLAAAACEAPSPVSTAPSSTGSAAPPPTTASPATPAPAPPDDLNVDELKTALKCADDAKSGPCALLAKMAECKPWSATSPAGEGRWLGRASVVADGKITDSFAILRLKAAPLAEVGPGQLPAKIALAEIPRDEGAAFGTADRAIRAFERGDVPPKSLPILDYVQRRTEWPDAFAMRTRGGQVYAIAHGGTFYCEGPRKQLLAVQRAATRSGSGDGIYTELWATTW